MLRIGFNVKFVYRGLRIPNKIECFLDISLKITVSTSRFDRASLRVAILAAHLEKAVLVCCRVLEFSVLQVLSCW